MSKIDNFADFQPANRQEWREWLSENYEKAAGIWLVYYKKASGKPRVTYDEAVEEALCFGWIDSLPRKLDDERAKLLFTPRKLNSVWSKLNKTRVEKLVANGAMTEIGLAKIEAAKIDGSWNTLNDSDDLKIPDDLLEKLADNKIAQANFDKFSASVRKNILAWIASAKRDATRVDRLEKTVEMAAKNKRANFDKE